MMNITKPKCVRYYSPDGMFMSEVEGANAHVPRIGEKLQCVKDDDNNYFLANFGFSLDNLLEVVDIQYRVFDNTACVLTKEKIDTISKTK